MLEEMARAAGSGCFKDYSEGRGGKEMKVWKKLQIGMFTMLMVFTGLLLYGSDVRAAVSGDYEYEENEEGVTITKYNGSGGNVVIPSEIDGRKVTEVGGHEEGEPGYYVYQVGAFENCSSVTSVSIPDSVTSIGLREFKDCINLRSVNIPEGVTNIEGRAFEGCKSLVEINLPSGLTNIGLRMFTSCESLTEINLPSNITSIGSEAFSHCISLTSIEIPASVTSIDEYMLCRGCNSLASIKVEEGNAVYDSRDDCNAIIETGSNTLLIGSISTVIPSSVTSIKENAFYENNGLRSIEIPSSVTSIGGYAFYGCGGLTGIKISPSVTSIGCYTFSGF